MVATVAADGPPTGTVTCPSHFCQSVRAHALRRLDSPQLRTGSKHAPDRHRWRCSHVDVPVWRLSQIGSVTHLGGSAVRMPGDHALALEMLSLWSLALARTIHGRPVDHARRVGVDESGRVSQPFPSSIPLRGAGGASDNDAVLDQR